MTLEEIYKKARVMRDLTIKCVCGHSVVVLPTYGFNFCSWCGRKIVRVTKDTFKKELEERLKGNVQD